MSCTSRIRALSREDIGALGPLQPEGWQDIKPSFVQYLDFPDAHYPICIDAENQSPELQLAAIGNLNSFGSTSWLSQIITHPDHRRKGYGRQVVEFLVARAKKNGAETVSLIATDFGRPLYAQCGFIDDFEYQFFKAPETPKRLEYKQTKLQVRDAKYKEFDYICELDRAVTGEDRSLLLRHHKNTIRLCINSNDIQGFWVPDLREGPIIALNKDAGRVLVQEKANRLGRITIPAANKDAWDFLTELGYQTNKRAWRMINGKRLSLDPSKIWSRIAGAFG